MQAGGGFWRPSAGDDDAGASGGTGARSERDRGVDEEARFAVFNANDRLSLQQQRARLRSRKESIQFLVERHPTLVLVGETGSGKTTQVPQYLYEAGWAPDGRRIAVTQPRRVAAMSVAARVAEEMGSELGGVVGYTIRFDDRTSASTRVQFMTDGVLSREMMLDPLLLKYTVVMVDEAHERSVHTDILLALLKKVQRRRPDLRLIVSSATVNAEELRVFFDGSGAGVAAATAAAAASTPFGGGGKLATAPAVQDVAAITVEGRAHPVDILYLPEPVPDYRAAVVETVLSIHRREQAGDILVFLTGQEEIESVCGELGTFGIPKLSIVPLYAGLPMRNQMQAFSDAPAGHRKVVVSTNIAETSVTIPGVVYVVDCGFSKQRWYDSGSGSDTLLVAPISKASATQRAGRAGRVRNGRVFRLYTESAFAAMREGEVPEMQRTNIAPTILFLKALGIRDVAHFDFVSPPPAASLARALELLYALGALDDNGDLTNPVGLRIAEFPVEPMMAKMLLEASRRHCAGPVLSIAAMLSVQSVFTTAGKDNATVEQLKRKFSVVEGDHITLLNVYNHYKAQGRDQVAAFCKKFLLNQKVLERADDIRRQLKNFMWRFRLPIEDSDDIEGILKSVTAGFFAQAARKQPDGTYRTVKDGQIVSIHPSSVCFKLTPPDWIVYHETLVTTKRFVREVSVIRAEWLAELAPHFYEWRRAGDPRRA